jgi:sodium transport system permease protein
MRDRQTVTYTVWLPLLLYPLLFWVMLQGATLIRGRNSNTEVSVQVAGDGFSYPRLQAALEASDAGGPLDCVRSDAAFSEPQPEASATALLENPGGPDALLWIRPEGAQLYYSSTQSKSKLAFERVSARLELLRQELRVEAQKQAGVVEIWDHLAPYNLVPYNLASNRELSAYMFSFILPLTFIIMAVMGAFYPAVDCTAGEKERGTAQTTLLLAAPRLGVQLGKIGAVTVAAAVATLLNLTGLVLAAEPLLAGSGSQMSLDLPLGTLFLCLPICASFLFTTSAILVAMASFTETFKQGQSLLSMVQLFFIMPATFAVMPSIELTQSLALVPIVQTVLAFKFVLGSDGTWLDARLFTVFCSQALYAGLAVWLCVRLSSLEALQETGISLKRLLSLRRSGKTPL